MNSDSNRQKEHFVFDFLKGNSRNTGCFIEPYTFQWNGTREHLLSHNKYGCRTNNVTSNYCAKLIQIDGWKISKDYPW